MMLDKATKLRAKIRSGDIALPVRAQSACRTAAEEATKLGDQAAGLILAIQQELKEHAAIAKVSIEKVAALKETSSGAKPWKG